MLGVGLGLGLGVKVELELGSYIAVCSFLLFVTFRSLSLSFRFFSLINNTEVNGYARWVVWIEWH